MARQQASTTFDRVEPSARPDGTRWPASRRRMSLGLMVPIFEASAFGGTPRFSDMLEITRTAADVGFEVAWFADHFSAPAEDDETPRGVWECFTTIAGLAAATSDLSINLGTLVACMGFRNPGVLAKMTESIDEISSGRFILGLGAGWHEPEYDMFGIPFDHRVSRFEEAVAIVTDLLRGGTSSREGRFFQTADAFNRPRGPRPASGGPPILIGTSGECMLRITARHADAWNTVWHPSADEAKPRLSALEDACRDVGRDFASIVKSAGGNIALAGCHQVRPNPMRGTVSELADAISEFHGLGFDHFVCGLDPCTVESVRGFSEVISAVERRLS